LTFFVPPYDSFAVSDLRFLISFAVFLTILAERMSAILGAEVAFYSVDSSEQLVYHDKSGVLHSGASAEDRQSMRTIARWVYQNQVAVGRGAPRPSVNRIKRFFHFS
jgi:hypothetical protein